MNQTTSAATTIRVCATCGREFKGASASALTRHERTAHPVDQATLAGLETRAADEQARLRAIEPLDGDIADFEAHNAPEPVAEIEVQPALCLIRFSNRPEGPMAPCIRAAGHRGAHSAARSALQIEVIAAAERRTEAGEFASLNEAITAVSAEAIDARIEGVEPPAKKEIKVTRIPSAIADAAEAPASKPAKAPKAPKAAKPAAEPKAPRVAKPKPEPKRPVREPAPEGTKWCAGSAKFGIEAHVEPLANFMVHSAAKDGLAAICRPHWAAYTKALAAAKKAAAPVTAETVNAGLGETVARAAKAPKAPKAAKPAADAEAPLQN